MRKEIRDILEGKAIDQRIVELVDSSAGPDACHPYLGRNPLLRMAVTACHVIEQLFFLKHGRFPRKYTMSCRDGRCCNIRHIQEARRRQLMTPDAVARSRSRGASRRWAAEHKRRAEQPTTDILAQLKQRVIDRNKTV
jgi:hypothetical protein